MSTDQLCPCGLTAANPAPRCRACPARTVPARSEGGDFEFGAATRPVTEPDRPGALMTYSRWTKSDNTFGPTGRVIATLLLLAPLPLVGMAIATGIGIIGAGIYIFVVMPLALRDIWKKAGTRIDPPVTVGARPRF
jgi:hypothetical protein